MVIIFAGIFLLLLFTLQRGLYRRWWNRGVSVKLEFEEEMVREGEEVKLLEIVENRKRLPLPSLKVKFQCSRQLEFPQGETGSVTDKYYRNDLFSIRPYQRITRSHQIHCRKRGYYGIYHIDLVGADLFFSEEMVESISADTVLYVLPKALAAQKISPALKQVCGEVTARRYELADPFTHRGIREYEPYDEVKAINWKATAKTGELKVNVKDHTAVSSVRIFMNLDDRGVLRQEELLEMGICICAHLTEELLYQGIRVSIFANAGDCVSGQCLEMEEITDASGMDEVLKSLARLDVESPMDKFEDCFKERLFAKGESIFTVFISPDQHDDFQEMVVRYRAEAGEDFVWICPVKKAEDQKAEACLADRTVFLLEETDE